MSQNEVEVLADILGETLLILTTGTATCTRLKQPKRNVDEFKAYCILKKSLEAVKIFGKYFSTKRFKYILNFLFEFKKKYPGDFENVKMDMGAKVEQSDSLNNENESILAE